MEIEQVRVLVVSNNADLVAGLRDIFDRQGYETVVAKSYWQALAGLAEKRLDFIIVDGSLPEATTSRFVAALRSFDLQATISLIAVVDHQAVGSEIPLLLAVDDWLLKPLHASELLIRTRQLLDKRALKERIRGLEFINESTLALSSSLDLDQVLAHVIQRVRTLTGFRRVVAFLLDKSQGFFVARAASCSPASLGLDRLDRLRLPADAKGIMDALANERQSLVRSVDLPEVLRTLSSSSRKLDNQTAILPLVVDGRVVGLLCLSEPGEARAALEFEAELIGDLSVQAATAISNAVKYEEARRREMESAFLLQAATAVDPFQALPNVLQSIVDEVVSVVYGWCGIYLVDGSSGELARVASSRSGHGESPGAGGRDLVGFAGLNRALADVLADGRPRLERYGPASPNGAVLAGERTEEVRSLLAVPIVGNGRALGILAAATFAGAEYEVSEQDLRLASALAERAAVGIVNLRLAEIVTTAKREWEETFDAIADGIFLSDEYCNIRRVNKAFAALFGEHPRDVVGRKCYELVWQRLEPCDLCPHASDVGSQISERSVLTAEFELKDRELQLTVYPALQSPGTSSVIVHVLKDVTERNRIQEMAISSEKLRIVGEMASGVAHDFNNMLASMIGWSEVALRSDVPAHLQPSLLAIHQAALDGAEAVRRIQEYTRINQDTEFSVVDVNEVIRGAVELARPRWKDWSERTGVAIDLSVQLTDVPPVWGNASDLREVLVNIIFNAVDAMDGGGEIRIRSGLQEDWVFMEVADMGIGMPEEVRRKIFDPFFTTKGSAGSGIGLSVAYGIVARHRGNIIVESEIGQGSTFRVWLPVSDISCADRSFEEEPPLDSASILLIDDDARVLNALEGMLRSQGHTVVSCLGGKVGVEMLRNSSFDLVMTDLGMPEMNGYEVAAAAKRIAPRIPVVLLTGWGNEIGQAHHGEHGIDAVISKPCRIAALRKTISDLLRPRHSPPEPCFLPDQVAELSPNCEADSKPLRILIVEDHRWFGEALQERLEIDGHTATLALSGTEGLEALHRFEFDVLLCDLKLPDMTGQQVAQAAARLGHKPFTVVTSGQLAPDGIHAFADCGADAFLPKPWKEQELCELLQRALEERSRRGCLGV